jgi:cell division protein FtsW
MVYAFIIEEYGAILGGAGLLLLYVILFFRTIRFASKCPKHFGRLTAIGLALLLVVQAFINMGVSVSLFPTTGQPLPLISLGGTSTVSPAMAAFTSILEIDYFLNTKIYRYASTCYNLHALSCTAAAWRASTRTMTR